MSALRVGGRRRGFHARDGIPLARVVHVDRAVALEQRAVVSPRARGRDEDERQRR